MTDLKQHQKDLLELLLKFDSICKENGIRYWLDSGTLLGAVRHSGFIPWDDDIDVCILDSDYSKAKKLLKANSHPPFEYQTSHKGQTRLCPRFVDNSKSITRSVSWSPTPKTEPIWIDTFIVRSSSLRAKHLIDPLYGRCVRRLCGGIHDGALKCIGAALLFPPIWIAKEFAILIGKFKNTGELVHDFGMPYYSIRKKKDIFPLSEVEFEGHKFPAPADPDSYLKLIYGDYMTLPEDKDKTDHNIQF